jgi:hypothetical protein
MSETADQTGSFNRAAFAAAVNMARQIRCLTWSQVAEQSGVSLPTLSRLNRGFVLSADTMARLVVWAELDANTFFTGQTVPACSLCGMPGKDGGSHKSLIDCVMALRTYVAILEQHMPVSDMQLVSQ